MMANSMIMACLINLSMFSSYKMCCYLYFVRLCLQVVQKKYQEKSGTGGSLGEIKSYGLQMSSSTLTQHLKHIHNVNASETGTKESQPQIVQINPFIITLEFNVFGSQIMFWLAKQLPPIHGSSVFLMSTVKL
jgi:hypothetical protein